MGVLVAICGKNWNKYLFDLFFRFMCV